MRSRDGNNYRSFAICSLIFFNSLVLNASEYLISYRYVVKNAILYNESLQISKAMRSCVGKPTSFIELPHYDSNNLNEIIGKNSQEFIDFIHKIGLNVEHKESTINSQNNSITILTLKTTCFKVDFNEYFARISHLK